MPMSSGSRTAVSCRLCAPALSAVLASGAVHAAPGYQIYVTNEKSDNISVIDGATNTVLGTIPIGKRPRGIHVSPDGRTVYVAVSGTPAAGPPAVDAQGKPVVNKAREEAAPADKSADGISVLDVSSAKVSGRIAAGSDPEEFALSRDGSRIYISNEDTKSATVINIAARKIEHVIPVGAEPEGVTTTPDGRLFYVTCEAGGDVFVVDTRTYQTAARFKVEGRPRSIDFTANGRIGIVPSESVGQVNIVDTARYTIIKTLTLPAGSRPMRALVAPDGGKIYVSNGRGGTISVLDGRTYDVVGSIQAGTRPWGIAISPDGKYLYSANGPSDDVSVIDLATDKEITRVKAGSSPWGLVLVPKGG
jgi:YVTN family beta-propeller protein